MLQHKTRFLLQQIKNSASTESGCVSAVLYCDLSDRTFAALSNENARRLQQCVRGLEKIASSKIGSDTTIKNSLTAEQYDEYVKSFDYDYTHIEAEHRDDMPWQLSHYLDKVREGDKYSRIANMFKRSTKRDSNGQTAYRRYLNKAEGCYEDAVMLLINTVDLDPTRNPNADNKVAGEVLRWLDRDVNPEPGFEPDASAAGVPRLRGSKSKYTLVDADPVVGVRLRKYWRQREALTVAAVELLYAEPEKDMMTDGQRQKMRDKLDKFMWSALRDDN